MTINIFPWQTKQWQHLQLRKESSKLPHALLLTGIEGVGKFNFAKEFAHSLLCSDKKHTCGSCKNCQLLKAGNHPDLLIISPEENKPIKVDVIREVIKFATYSAHIATDKIIIINNADKMNINAANALLKTLEEPAENVFLILTTHRLMVLPATVRSRCQILHFNVPDEQAALEWLQTQDVKKDSAPLLLKFAHGAPLKVLDFAAQDLLTKREKIFKQFCDLLADKVSLESVSKEWQKADVSQILFHLNSWVTDLIRLQSINNVELINFDFMQQLKNLTTKYDIKKLYKLYDEVVRSQNLLHGPCNLNSQLLLEGLLTSWLL